jgi:hypothetical protein
MRTLLPVLYLLGQCALILTAGRRPDHAFGFRMFHESSTLTVNLLRYVDAPSGHGTTSIPVDGTGWLARDPSGTLHRFDWRDRVREPALSTFGVRFHASYGAAAQLSRLRAALDDVAAHLPGDAETRQLGLEIEVRKNGGPPEKVSFTADVVPR